MATSPFRFRTVMSVGSTSASKLSSASTASRMSCVLPISGSPSIGPSGYLIHGERRAAPPPHPERMIRPALGPDVRRPSGPPSGAFSRSRNEYLHRGPVLGQHLDAHSVLRHLDAVTHPGGEVLPVVPAAVIEQRLPVLAPDVAGPVGEVQRERI